MKNKIIKITSIIASSLFCYNLLSSPTKTEAKIKRNIKRNLNSPCVPTIALTTITSMSIVGIAINAQKIENDKKNANSSNSEVPKYGFFKSK